MTYTDKEKQLRYDLAYLRMAHEWSKLSHCKRKQVGSIIVKNGMIISDGYNGAPAGFDNCCEDDDGKTHWFVLHAEANAISKVARSTNNAQDSTLYLTMSPCKDCCKMILQVGIKRVVYSTQYRDNLGLELLKSAHIEVEYIPVPE
ncbi:dCMP deaminase family protein [Cryomorpha ignava]|uniref:dCMP deaminase family protein n=1 Tax=Cryomorpha ignava TaxID=101383 RepID=A0A7K3WK55_9FLAO|nr:dCMP deaminase family protein [Cryomorpha ignava]